MGFDAKKLYKIVYKDGPNTKSPRGHIIDSDTIYITLKFSDGVKLFINHSSIISITELEDNK